MRKLSFEQISAENVGILINDLPAAKHVEDTVIEHKGVVFALKDGVKYIAASVMIFDMNTDILTVAMRKLYLSDLFVCDNAEHGIDGMMLEYTADKAKTMGFELITVQVSTDDLRTIKFYCSQGFDKIVKVNISGKYLVLQRDLNVKLTCCGSTV